MSVDVSIAQIVTAITTVFYAAVFAIGYYMMIRGNHQVLREMREERPSGGRPPEGKGEAPAPFCYRTPGQLVDLGEDGALVNILGTKASGLVSALIWKGVYLYKLGYNLNRAQVIADWMIDMFARPDTSKLFEDGTRPATGR